MTGLVADFWLIWRWSFFAACLILLAFRPRLTGLEWVGAVGGSAAACAIVAFAALLATGQ